MNLTQVWQVTHFIPTGCRRGKGVRQLGRNFLKSPNPSESQNRRGLIHIPHTLTVKSTPKSEEEIIAGWKRVQRIFQLLRSEMTTRLGDDRWYWVIIPQVFLTIQQYQTSQAWKGTQNLTRIWNEDENDSHGCLGDLWELGKSVNFKRDKWPARITGPSSTTAPQARNLIRKACQAEGYSPETSSNGHPSRVSDDRNNKWCIVFK